MNADETQGRDNHSKQEIKALQKGKFEGLGSILSILVLILSAFICVHRRRIH